MDLSRAEYPQPQFKREGVWKNLNGQWRFKFDDSDVGRKEKWQSKTLPDPRKITVPFVYQAPASGVNDQSQHDTVWYEREFEAGTLATDERLILHFGAVDYFADVYVNGEYIGHHEGGDGSFAFDVTDALTQNQTQQVTVRAADLTFDETIPRGKQSWTGKSEGIWYTNSTGIWQTVWLETVNVKHIRDIKLTPDLDHTSVQINAQLSNQALGSRLHYKITFAGEVVADDQIVIQTTNIIRSVELIQQHIFRTGFHHAGWTWTPENPNLFDVEFELITEDDQCVDHVDTYFGLRKVSTENGMIMLNNRPYYQRLVLDQGYWSEGLLTAPTDDALKLDIELSKEMGFNGCRKHQKIEDPRFLYWADKLGYLVWEEVASVPYYSEKSASRLIDAWKEAIERDYNHPSIIMWVPLNESWGVDQIHNSQQQQHFSESLYHMVHALDTTRLVQSNDGWDITTTDVVAIHNYSHGVNKESREYQDYVETLSTREALISHAPGSWDIFAKGFSYQGQPIVLSEFGGIGFDSSREDGWGYTTANNAQEYLSELQRILKAVAKSKGLWGYCYTQLTDVEQEVNGLLTYSREPKADLKEINKIFSMPSSARLTNIE
ncbi:glycoside hydrolase family 2 protein [Lapidilactobacillus bayanensis]|uniref:glycoside hydrolase family 2 protein n=1 Tax=Lapidilactobacillus bayanensis TaxID=2485998 RepID=UPI000F79D10D|nr:sugar-binding domain-containing protein [Lapidilactobacillus bayanensis]